MGTPEGIDKMIFLPFKTARSVTVLMGYRHKSPKALEDPLLQAIRLPLPSKGHPFSSRRTPAYDYENTALIYFDEALKWPFKSSGARE